MTISSLLVPVGSKKLLLEERRRERSLYFKIEKGERHDPSFPRDEDYFPHPDFRAFFDAGLFLGLV
jgi:hypothetical protein